MRSNFFSSIATLFITLIVFTISNSEAQPIVQYPPALIDPTMDGAFTNAAEYGTAFSFLNLQGDGTFYTQHRNNWTPPGGSITYPGITMFTLHDIWGYTTQELADYNTYEATWAGQKAKIWVFANGNELNDSLWIGGSGLGYAAIDDVGFVARLNDDPTSDYHWMPGDPVPGDPLWNWNRSYGLFGAAGFNNTAFTFGYRANPITSNEVYEFAFYGAAIPGGGNGPEICNPIDTTVLDPKEGQPSPQPPETKGVFEAHAIAGPVEPVPEPSTFLLLGLGVAGLIGIGRKKSTNKKEVD